MQEKKNIYIRQIKGKGDNYKEKFIPRKENFLKFLFPEKDAFSSIEKDDIKMKFPQPTVIGKTYRAISSKSFSVNFSLVKDKMQNLNKNSVIRHFIFTIGFFVFLTCSLSFVSVPMLNFSKTMFFKNNCY